MIPVVKEPKGLSPLEHCYFCDMPTLFWHKRTNTPLCKQCANKHSVIELPVTYSASFEA